MVASVHPTNEFDADLLGTRSLALRVVATGAEALLLHALDHLQDPSVPLGLTLGQETEMGHLGGGEQHGGTVGTRRHAGSAADARRSVQGLFGDLRVDGDRVGLRLGASVDRDVAAGLQDPIEGRTVDHEIADHRKGSRPPRLQGDLRAVTEVAHVELAGGRTR
jgi:hypothetical protein